MNHFFNQHNLVTRSVSFEVALFQSRGATADNSLGFKPLSLPTFLACLGVEFVINPANSTAQRSKMVAVGRAAHLRSNHARSIYRPRSGSQKSSATRFGVEIAIFLRIRGCASRPTATILDPIGIKKMWVTTRVYTPGYQMISLRDSGNRLVYNDKRVNPRK